MTVKHNMTAFNDLFTQSLERMSALGELNLKLGERMAQRQLDAVNLYLEQGTRMMQLGTEAKGYADLYKGQVEMTRDMGAKLMDESRANMQIAGELRDEYRAWMNGLMDDMRQGKETVEEAMTA
jgi:hypothetical protein